MSKPDELLEKVLDGDCDANISFLGLRALLLRLGFRERVRGSHHFFRRPDGPGILNLQRRGHEVKPYQVRQARRLFVRLGIGGDR